PQRGSVCGLKRKDVARSVTGEGQARLGRQNASRARAFAEIMVPLDLPGLKIDSSQECLPGNSIICAGPAVRAVYGLEEIDAVSVLRADDEQTGLWIETRRTIIRGTGFVGRDETAVARRFLCGIGDGAALIVDPGRPIHCREWNGEQALTVGTIEYEEVAVARSLQQHLSRRAC